MKLFTLKDVKAESFGAPIAMPSTGIAMRSLLEIAENPNSPVGKYPADFILYELGEWDPSNAQIILHQTMKYVVTVSDLINQAMAARSKEGEKLNAPSEILKKVRAPRGKKEVKA